MKNFCKWLERNNIKYQFKTYGNNYFYNAPALLYEAIEIEISSISFCLIDAEVKKISKYCKRYNLEIFNNCRLQKHYSDNKYYKYLSIRTQDQKNNADIYDYYANKSVIDCESLIHQYHIQNKYKTHSKELNFRLKSIMDYCGAQYNRSQLKAV